MVKKSKPQEIKSKKNQASFWLQLLISILMVVALDILAGSISDFDDNVLLSDPQFHGVGEWYYNERFRALADRGIELGQDYLLKLKALCDAKISGSRFRSIPGTTRS